LFFHPSLPQAIRHAEIVPAPIHAAINDHSLVDLGPNLRSIGPHLGKPVTAKPIPADKIRRVACHLDERLSVCRGILAEMAISLPKYVRDSSLIN
jgi:hypothetical protein